MFEEHFDVSGIDINNELTKIGQNFRKHIYQVSENVNDKNRYPNLLFLEYFISKNIERVFHKEIKICQIPCAFSQHIFFVFHVLFSKNFERILNLVGQNLTTQQTLLHMYL